MDRGLRIPIHKRDNALQLGFGDVRETRLRNAPMSSMWVI